MSEQQLYGMIENYLVAQSNYQNVGTRKLYSGHTPDLLFKFSSYLVAVEVKKTSEDAIDALSTLFSLIRSPDVNAAILVVPEGKTTSDLTSLADQSGVGLATINTENGRWGWIRQPKFSVPSFNQQWNYPTEVATGQEFTITITIRNGGQKLLADVSVGYVVAYPFAVPQGKTNSVKVAEIAQGGSAPFTLSVKARDDANKGAYPLFIKVELLGAPPNYQTMEIRVK